MRIHKYIPDRMFGFAIDASGKEVFFHLGGFDPGAVWITHPRCKVCRHLSNCGWIQSPPPPILGEDVEVLLDPNQEDSGKAPRASRIIRRVGPPVMYGTVETFDSQRGYGFVRGEEGEIFHLHASEILDKRIPVPGQTVMFFAGVRQSRPRACHVKVCPG
jgi:cold shock CspA family protein